MMLGRRFHFYSCVSFERFRIGTIPFTPSLSKKRSRENAVIILPRQQQPLDLSCRWFAAWRPGWKQKARKYKLTAAKKKHKAIQAEQARMKKLIGRRIKIPKLHEQLIQPAESIQLGTQQQSLSKEQREINMMSILQTFTATSSPFMCLAAEEDEANQMNANDPFWDHDAAYRQSSSVFEYLSPATFDFELPDTKTIAEVAFLGRSNVGKSSLMNALMQAKLARTSKQPGRTQMVSYYGMKNMEINDMKKDSWKNSLGFLVDLPGYGYARGPDEVVADWQARTQDYLVARSESGHLRRLYLLIDSRHNKEQETDFAIMKWLDKEAPQLPYTAVLTKIDGVRGGPRGLVPHLNALAMRYQKSHFQPIMSEFVPQNRPVGAFYESEERPSQQSPIIHLTSAAKKLGVDELWKSVCYEFKQGPFPRANGLWDAGEA